MQTREYGKAPIPLRDSVPNVGVPAPERRVHISSAASITAPRRIRHIDEGTAESEIEQHAEEGEEGNAAETAYKQQGEDCVQDAGAGDAFYGSDVDVDVQAVVVQCGQEVGEDCEDHSCAAELHEAEEEGEGLEGHAAKSHGDWIGLGFVNLC